MTEQKCAGVRNNWNNKRKLNIFGKNNKKETELQHSI